MIRETQLVRLDTRNQLCMQRKLKSTHHCISVKCNAFKRSNSFRGTLLLPSVRTEFHRHQSCSPRVSQIPVFLTKHWEKVIICGWIGNITDVEQDSFKVFTTPFWTMFCNDSSSIDVVSFKGNEKTSDS